MTDVSGVLRHLPSDYINGRFVPIAGETLRSTDPAQPRRIIWSGAADANHIDKAVHAAASALDEWSRKSLEDRAAFLRRWAQVTSDNADRIASLITDEMGKTLAESRVEAKALGEKVNITLDRISLSRVIDYQVPVSESREGFCRFKPHGVMAVIGPFNFPAHLPNGHFVPALLLGNTIVLKPSEKTPAVGQLLAELMDEIGAPPGVFNVVQGTGDIAATLANHPDINGILFTGSWPVGRKILEANLDRPGRIIALEMGGNNPSVVMDDAHLKQAVIENARSAFATTGQRCTCTRRIIVQRSIAEKFIPAFCKAASTLLIGPGRSTAPIFMGPIINETSLNAVLEFQRDLVHRGGRILLEATRAGDPDSNGGYFVTPGVVEVKSFSADHDCEVFGPFAQISIVTDLDEAIEQANASRYGLAASIFATHQSAYEEFFRRCHAGCINWNTGTAGASSKLPFGGVKHSGNYRPAGAFSVDYSAYPVANMVEKSADAAIPAGMTWNDRWI
ncbi:MAG: aldehyde dehydrogenase family protein [Phycisphaerales bacterium]|nr:aldehyde dehydrogenase family protein [Phycisphaerales bacterium]MCI0630559.1 aldehyde dehydrogenase family protein [Phycisphaerales bacterium]MCI0676004.1 aldehyde dehydrogenase family protein [Phycisphaerales bacterium]